LTGILAPRDAASNGLAASSLPVLINSMHSAPEGFQVRLEEAVPSIG
jgi:hypothetical protein